MTYRLILFIVFFLSVYCGKTGFAHGNNLVLCTTYSNEAPYGMHNAWVIDKQEGNYMYVYYQSDTLITDTVFISLHKTVGRRDTNYYNYDRYFLVTDDSTKKWAVNKYTFTDAGKYKIAAYNRKSTIPLAVHYTTIEFKEVYYRNSFFYDTWFYSNTSVIFCDSVSNEKVFGESKSFNYKDEGNTINLYVTQNNESKLRTDILLVKVYDVNSNNKLVSAKAFHINRDWHWAFVPLKLSDKGTYLVEVFDESEIFINSSTLEIK